MHEEILLKFKGSLIKLNIRPSGDDLELTFRYHEALKDEIKQSMSKAKWSPSTKGWVVPNSQRTRFILDYLQGKPIFDKFDQVLVEYKSRRTPYSHQYELTQHGLTRKTAIWAAEPGVGKTFSAIELMEQSGLKRWWFVAPRSAIEAVKLEFKKWNTLIYPQLMTYEGMTKAMKGWKDGDPPPDGVIFDEAHKLKSPQAQRSQAALYLANHIRDLGGYVILMTGTPAPKSPLDWWMLCEIACPGFLREGSYEKFRDRVALVKTEENIGGMKYPKLITFRDDVNKCNVCGKFNDNEIHKIDTFNSLSYVPKGEATSEADLPHEFKPMNNEIEILHKRMEGLVMVKFKKDCLSLPERIFRKIELKPTAITLRTAKLIAKSAPTVAQALILLREFSDGFQYHSKLIETLICDDCKGNKKIQLEGNWIDCPHCSSNGYIKKFETVPVETATPKIDALVDLLDEREEQGRFVVYAGFTASLDRVCATVKKQGWKYIRVDGRGWHSDLGTTDPSIMLETFQGNSNDKICFVGHPASAGTGLTLTASDSILFYSNDFNAESRLQAMERINRIGSRGNIIIDLVHLPVDQLILDNLQRKQDLMKVTMGDIIGEEYNV